MTKQKVKFRKHYWVAVSDNFVSGITGRFFETKREARARFPFWNIIKVQIKEIL